MSIDLPSAVVAVGSLGTAAFGLVDATKAFSGGISNRGFGHVERLLEKLVPAQGAEVQPLKAVLRANWLNGTASLADQKAIAKTLVKLQLNPGTAAHFAAQTGVDPTALASIAGKYAVGGALDADEQNVAGRFDLQLSTLLDEAYQRGDQSYRNSAKVLAIVISVLLAAVGKLALADPNIGWGEAIIAGLLAAPLAPVSKDLASALQAATKALQVIRK